MVKWAITVFSKVMHHVKIIFVTWLKYFCNCCVQEYSDDLALFCIWEFFTVLVTFNLPLISVYNFRGAMLPVDITSSWLLNFSFSPVFFFLLNLSIQFKNFSILLYLPILIKFQIFSLHRYNISCLLFFIYPTHPKNNHIIIQLSKVS